MIALSTPNHPLRLAGVLAASFAFFAIIAGAVFAATWMVDNARSPHTNQVLGAGVGPSVAVPAGLVAVQRVNSLREFEQAGGFKPFIPMYVPRSTQTDFTLSLTLPDANGARVGRVGYSSKDLPADAGGTTGPTVVLAEAPGAPGDNADPTLRRLKGGNGRGLAATIGCQGLTVDVQMYFSPAPAAGEPFVTPHMTAVAQEFVDGLNAQCARP